MLLEYLKSREKEVVDIMITLYDEQEVMERYILQVREQTIKDCYQGIVIKQSLLQFSFLICIFTPSLFSFQEEYSIVSPVRMF